MSTKIKKHLNTALQTVQSSLWICKENLFVTSWKWIAILKLQTLFYTHAQCAKVWSTIRDWLYIRSMISTLVSSYHCSVLLGINGLQDVYTQFSSFHLLIFQNHHNYQLNHLIIIAIICLYINLISGLPCFSLHCL